MADTDALRLAGVSTPPPPVYRTANLRLVEHIEVKHPRRVKWTKHTGFPNAYGVSVYIAF